MKLSTPINPSIINKNRVKKQFDRRAYSKDSLFLYDEIFHRMFEKLDYIKVDPKRIIDLGCGDGRHFSDFRNRFKNAQYIGVDFSDKRLAICQSFLNKNPLLKKRFLVGSKPAEASCLLADMANTEIDPERAELVWANLSVHCHPNPLSVFSEIRRLLKTEGLLMFSTFGPATFRELRDAIEHAGLKNVQTHPFIDMHDYGDMLLECGFADPVMDQELLKLTYKSSKKLMDDIYAFGGNACTLPRSELSTKSGLQRLLEALEAKRNREGLLELTLEIAYGHAWKASSFRKGDETRVSLEGLRSHLNRKQT
ncbi:methyltransferase domain-containing protein [Taylorella equigenitalis]|uniref:methyltransferase domain-containing protein n=1 Tax=Taylorella equigenitalis TaxID=29575 RepID=UPI00237D2C14|nr:methyltransferase domain-containing protein [Taylorella equigenitalis]WDU54919.1 methyltransferase domain-containing protein [Taylorella equigenitalis]